VLFGTEFWSGLLDWMKDRLLSYGNISGQDFELITLTDDIDEVVDVMTCHRRLKLEKIERAKQQQAGAPGSGRGRDI